MQHLKPRRITIPALVLSIVGSLLGVLFVGVGAAPAVAEVTPIPDGMARIEGTVSTWDSADLSTIAQSNDMFIVLKQYIPDGGGRFEVLGGGGTGPGTAPGAGDASGQPSGQIEAAATYSFDVPPGDYYVQVVSRRLRPSPGG